MSDATNDLDAHPPSECTYLCLNTGDEVLAYRDERHVVLPSDDVRRLRDRVAELEGQLEDAQLRSIEARNPGIDIERVKRERRALLDTPQAPRDEQDG